MTKLQTSMLSKKIIFAVIFFTLYLNSVAGLAQEPNENPWVELSKPLISEDPIPSLKNNWRGDESSSNDEKIDESKYPPLDENVTLGTEYPAMPPENTPSQSSIPPVTGTSVFRYPQVQDYEAVPVYPSSPQRSMPAYGYRPTPMQRPGFQPGYPAGYGSGYNRGRMPFGGNQGGGFPFDMGNNWMPFSGSGFW